MPEKDKGTLEKVLEAYKPIPMKRMFYPRGFKLSDQFIDSFHMEYDRLVGEGINPRSLMERFGKALRFHVTEKRRYNQPVVEAGMAGNWSPAPESSTQRRTRQKLETKEKDVNASKRFGQKKEKDIRADVSNLKKDPHEGDRGEAKRG
jgi:hypothetical protein